MHIRLSESEQLPWSIRMYQGQAQNLKKYAQQELNLQLQAAGEMEK